MQTGTLPSVSRNPGQGRPCTGIKYTFCESDMHSADDFDTEFDGRLLEASDYVIDHAKLGVIIPSPTCYGINLRKMMRSFKVQTFNEANKCRWRKIQPFVLPSRTRTNTGPTPSLFYYTPLLLVACLANFVCLYSRRASAFCWCHSLMRLARPVLHLSPKELPPLKIPTGWRP